jgi:hypothetical protein
LGNGHLSHPAIECRFQNVAPIFDRRTLKNMITGIGHGLPRRLLRFVRVRSRLFLSQRLCFFLSFSLCLSASLSLLILAGLGYDLVGLISMLRRQLAMPLQDFFGREQFLAVSGAVCRDLRSSRAVDPRFTEMVFDLFAARA